MPQDGSRSAYTAPAFALGNRGRTGSDTALAVDRRCRSGPYRGAGRGWSRVHTSRRPPFAGGGWAERSTLAPRSIVCLGRAGCAHGRAQNVHARATRAARSGLATGFREGRTGASQPSSRCSLTQSWSAHETAGRYGPRQLTRGYPVALSVAAIRAERQAALTPQPEQLFAERPAVAADRLHGEDEARLRQQVAVAATTPSELVVGGVLEGRGGSVELVCARTRLLALSLELELAHLDAGGGGRRFSACFRSFARWTATKVYERAREGRGSTGGVYGCSKCTLPV